MTFSNKNKTYYWIILLCLNTFFMAFGQKLPKKLKFGINSSNQRTVNINKPIGIKYQHSKRAVIIGAFRDGKGATYCTGTLLNTVNQNGELYIITAGHCPLLNRPTMKGVIFKMVNPSNPIGTNPNIYLSADREALPPSSRTETQNEEDKNIYPVEGTIVVLDIEALNAANNDNKNDDIALIRIKDLPKDAIQDNVYYAGWNLNKAAKGTAVIAHPEGDLKKMYEWSRYPELSDLNFENDFHPYYHINYPKPYKVISPLEKGANGSGLLDKYNHVIGIQSKTSSKFFPELGEVKTSYLTPLWSSWRKRINFYNNIYRYYSFPKKEIPLLQEFLDPNFTYVSQVPGGYGFYKNSRYLIPDTAFNLNIEAGETFSTPEFEPEGSTNDMIKLNIWELLQKDTKAGSPSTLLDVIKKGGIYSLKEDAELELKILAYPNPNNLTFTQTLLHISTAADSIDSGHFKNKIISTASFTQIVGAGITLGISINKPFEYKLPVVIKITNTGETTTNVRALRIPGLGYRNAVELFKPDQFKELYKDHSYPDSYGSTGTATVTDLDQDSNESTMPSAILHATEITPSSEISNSSNPSSPAFSYKFITEDNGGYINLLQHTLRFEAKKTVKITYKTKTSGNQKHVGAWIDYNKSRNFEEDERVFSPNDITTDEIEISFTVPDISGITTRMRLGYRTEGNLPEFADQNFTNGEMEDYSVHIYKNTKKKVTATSTRGLPENLKTGDYYLNKAPEVNEGASTSTAPNLCLEAVIAATQVTGTQIVTPSLSFTNFVDPSGGSNTNSCQTLKITPHPEAATNGLYALSFGRAENTRYIAIDLNREREPTPFLEDTLLSYGLTAIKSDTPNYLQISRLNSDTSKLVIKHAQYDAYSFSYTLTPTYQYNSPIDELENSIAQSHNNTTIVNKAAAIGGTVGTTVVGVAAVGVYAYKSINQTVASAEEQIPLTRSGEVVSEVRQGIFQRVKNFFVRAYKYCTGKLD